MALAQVDANANAIASHIIEEFPVGRSRNSLDETLPGVARGVPVATAARRRPHPLALGHLTVHGRASV